MSVAEALVLLVTGIAAGIASTVASVASFVSYPVLLAIGLPPLSANVTNTMSLVWTSAGSVVGSRPELAGQRERALRLAIVTALGGAAGACALLLAPASTFALVIPVLIGAASLLLLIQPALSSSGGTTPRTPRGMSDRKARVPDMLSSSGGTTPRTPRGMSDRKARVSDMLSGLSPRPGAEGSVPRMAALFAGAMYIGYFGAAGGMILLAILATMFADSLIRLNALKNVITGMANAVAAVAFAAFAPVDWAVVPLLAAGFLIGGMAGPRIARRLPARALRLLVSVCGLALAVKLGLSAYR